MRILGVEIKSPPVREFSLAALLIAVIASMGGLFASLEVVEPARVWPTVAAASTGILLAAHGVSLAKHGWRAAAIMVAASTVVFLLIG